MSKETKFIILQGSVVFNRQISLFDEKYEDTKEGRNNAFRATIHKLQEKKVIKISPRITEYVLVYKTSISDDIIYCQLAKRTQMEAYKLSGNDIKQEQIDSYPPLDVFINLKQQQFAVELNTSILIESSIETNIKNLINSLVKEFSIFVNTVQSKKEFWDLVDDEDEIQEISFDLVVPNFFNATGDANDLVSNAKDKLNADSVGLTIKNKKGKLKAELSAIDSYVRYASQTGAWKLKIKQNGETKYKTIHSTDCCLKKTIESDLLDLLKKVDENWQVGTEVYNGLLAKLNGLFNDEN